MKQISLSVRNDVNFTPAGLMKAYADQTPSVVFTRNVWGNARLIIEGNVYEYHHWSLCREDDDRLLVTLTLALDI